MSKPDYIIKYLAKRDTLDKEWRKLADEFLSRLEHLQSVEIQELLKRDFWDLYER